MIKKEELFFRVPKKKKEHKRSPTDKSGVQRTYSLSNGHIKIRLTDIFKAIYGIMYIKIRIIRTNPLGSFCSSFFYLSELLFYH